MKQSCFNCVYMYDESCCRTFEPYLDSLGKCMDYKPRIEITIRGY